MREIIARIVCASTMCVVVAVSWMFAATHNPQLPGAPGPLMAEPTPSASAAAAQIQSEKNRADVLAAEKMDRGPVVYAQHKCSNCHSLAGAGNPRYPLDGVAARRSRAELKDWITGTGSAAKEMSPTVARRKQRYQDMPQDDMNALVAYLVRLAPDK